MKPSYKLLISHLINQGSLNPPQSHAQRKGTYSLYCFYIRQLLSEIQLGFEGMNERAAEVDSCFKEAKVISENHRWNAMEIANLDF